MTDYREEYERILRDKHELKHELSVVIAALEETQHQLSLARTMNDALLSARRGDDHGE